MAGAKSVAITISEAHVCGAGRAGGGNCVALEGDRRREVGGNARRELGGKAVSIRRPKEDGMRGGGGRAFHDTSGVRVDKWRLPLAGPSCGLGLAGTPGHEHTLRGCNPNRSRQGRPSPDTQGRLSHFISVRVAMYPAHCPVVLLQTWSCVIRRCTASLEAPRNWMPGTAS